MTATCASPMARRICSPVSERSTRAVGSSSSIRASAGPILSRSPLDSGSIATCSVGSGNTIAIQAQAQLARRERVAGLGHAQLGHGADLAGAQLGGRLLLLAVEVEQLADALVLALGRVERAALALERPGQHAQVGQPADERVGRGLEHADQQLAARGLHGDDLAGLVGGGVRALLLGRREVADDRVEERAEADALGGRGDQHRRQDRLAHALVEARVQLGVGDVLLAEVLLEHGVVGLGRGLEQLVAARATSSASSAGTGISTSLPPSNR